MKFRYLVTSCCGDLPFGTNSRTIAMQYTTTEEHYVIDTEENSVIYNDIDSEDLAEVTESHVDLQDLFQGE